MSDRTKKQHYVPQFYLKHFASIVKGDKYFINYLDKIRFAEGSSNVKNIAHENLFYDVSTEMFNKLGVELPENFDPQELEKMFSRYESQWAETFREIREREENIKTYSDETIAHFLTNDNKESLSSFLALQAIRTPAWRTNVRKVQTFLKENDMQWLAGEEYDEYRFYSHIHSGVIERLSAFFQQSFDWILGFSRPLEMITSDNPLVRIVHLKNHTQANFVSWPAPPYFEEYSIALTPHLLLILAQNDRSEFVPDLFPDSNFVLNDPVLFRRYNRFHIINAIRNIFYFGGNAQLKLLKGTMQRMAQTKVDYLTQAPFFVSVPDDKRLKL